MVNRKPIRTRGKLQFSKLFQKLGEGDKVAIVEERSRTINFPKRLQGRTGTVVGKQGRNYKVKLKDQALEKMFLVEPIHLKKITGKQ